MNMKTNRHSLEYLIRKRGLSKKAFCEKIDITFATLNNKLRKGNWTMDEIEKVCNLLKVDRLFIWDVLKNKTNIVKITELD